MKKSLLFLLILLIVASCSGGEFVSLNEISGKYKLTTEEELQDSSYYDKLKQFFDAVDYNYFYGQDSISIAYKVFNNTKSTEAIVISSGRTESIPKYMEVIFDLYDNGYSVYILDHRGQGMSERIFKEDPEMGYVEDFQNYIDDLKTFYDLEVVPNKHSQIFLLGHSMGGAISTLYVEQNKSDFNAIALSSPMYGLSFPSCEVANLLGGETIKYAPTQKGYQESIDEFEGNTLTTSKVRYSLLMKIQNEIKQIQLGGSSYQWLEESCNAMNLLYENVGEIEIPLLLLQGSDEEIVKPSSHYKVISKMRELNKPVIAYQIDGAKHELLIERDELRNTAVSRILDFFKKN